jgi:hypothetical protein
MKFKAGNFRKVLRFIKQHPERWRQNTGIGPCGCFLFHAARIAKLETEPRVHPDTKGLGGFLGVDRRTLSTLFNPENTIDYFEACLRARTRKRKARG